MKMKTTKKEDTKSLKQRMKLTGEAGTTMLEYALLGTLIVVVCAASVGVLGQEASEMFSKVGSGFNQ